MNHQLTHRAVQQIKAGTTRLNEAMQNAQPSVSLMGDDAPRWFARHYFEAAGCVFAPIIEKGMYVAGQRVSVPTKPLPALLD